MKVLMKKLFYISGQRSDSKNVLLTISHSCSLVLSYETPRPLQRFSKEAIHLLKVRGQGAHTPSVDVNWISEQGMNFKLLH